MLCVTTDMLMSERERERKSVCVCDCVPPVVFLHGQQLKHALPEGSSLYSELFLKKDESLMLLQAVVASVNKCFHFYLTLMTKYFELLWFFPFM